MIFFSAVVSPSVFASLNSKGSSRFLRTILSNNLFNSTVLIIIGLSFLINRNYLTPLINNFRDQELEGNSKAAKNFKLMHLLSVLLFIINFFLLILVIVLNYINYNL